MDRDELLRQLDILATYMPQYFDLDNEINKLKGRLFKSRSQIDELEQKKKTGIRYCFSLSGSCSQRMFNS